MSDIFQAPVGGWTVDKKLADIGRYTQLTLENDMEGEFPGLPLLLG